jgi:hypothetical protein
MSYSFGVKGATKAEVIKLCNEQFDAVELNQPVHKKDLPVVRAAVEAFVNTLQEEPGRDFGASVHGSIWDGNDVSVNIQIGKNPTK